MNIDAIADFVIKYSPEKKGKSQYIEENKEKIKEVITQHINYKTCIVVHDLDGVAVVCRWNISRSGTIAHILDLIIKPEYRNKRYINRLLIKGLKLYPDVKFLEWERETKYPNRERQYFPVDKILKRS